MVTVVALAPSCRPPARPHAEPLPAATRGAIPAVASDVQVVLTFRPLGVACTGAGSAVVASFGGRDASPRVDARATPDASAGGTVRTTVYDFEDIVVSSGAAPIAVALTIDGRDAGHAMVSTETTRPYGTTTVPLRLGPGAHVLRMVHAASGAEARVTLALPMGTVPGDGGSPAGARVYVPVVVGACELRPGRARLTPPDGPVE